MALVSITFIRLSLDHLNNLVEASSKDLTTPSMLYVVTYSVWHYLAISKFLIIKKKFIKKILNNKGLIIEPCGTPKIISFQLLQDKFILARCFLFDR